ncbi:double-stranded RNA-binding protein 4 isoform X1 [Arachis ipaensis]|uniref:double-stranded RNA-binding protein 4 isoform X1 n=1 Tax=Arachis ipaensis TaxID=130454 RepID=UPI0007AFC6EA|nr:double-stranded RNA-binding protein 4 isoform X1 [Arachis ipaensis]XP_025638513.1 double-stranded RNA-binding protein 4 isoform X1 [Arachis hypogaea]
MELPTQIQLPEHMADSSSSPQPPPQPPTSSSLVQHVSPSSSPLPQHLRYKNRLQEFAQRSNMPLPGYQTTNEGTPHAPKFRATVWVDGISYTSQMTFSQRKAAEQDAARLALESLNEKIRDDRCPLVFENTLISKSIMNEYATKLNVDRPTYNTVKLEGLLPRFMSFVIFNGTKYTSVIGKNKKEAEQLAARAAILSVLAGDSSSTTLYEIIRSKSSFYGIAKSNESQVTNGSIVLPIGTTGYDFDLQHHNVLPVATTEYASGLQDHKDKEVPMATNNGEKRIDVVPASSNMLSSSQELQMPIHVPCVEGPFPPKSSSLQPVGSELGQLAASDSSNSGSKRRKNKKKANKKARLESMVPSAADPCSVAQ